MHVETGAFGHRFAHVQRLQQRQFGHVLLEQSGETQQDFFAFLGRQLRPHAAVECLPGHLDRDVDIFSLAGRHVVQHLAVARGNVGEGRAAQRVDEPAVNEGLPWQFQGGDSLLNRSDINESVHAVASPVSCFRRRRPTTIYHALLESQAKKCPDSGVFLHNCCSFKPRNP
ncbi:hypothetical protein D3C87_1616240 [compost metagenome]